MALYILQNQYGQFLNRQLEWVESGERDPLFRTPNRDEALNQLIEINAKEISLRISVITCDADSKGNPVLPQPSAEDSAA